ncbi:MAG TPA: acetyltransferase [Ramlibacter sp.]|nr:acetyltransferase [Ramlibacter sp.]
MPGLLILGAGGHGRVVADAALRAGAWDAVAATDRNASRCQGELLPGVALLDPAPSLAAAAHVHIAIGSARSREQEAAQVTGSLATVVHPQASLSRAARVGEGCFIAAQAIVGPCAVLGRCVIVNHGAVVDHDVTVGDFSHIAPLAALGGAVKIGQRVLIGSGASVLPGVSIGDDVIVGAGAVVNVDLRDAGTYVGVPARRVK